MNLSKKEEKELLKVYETWWHSYLNGDIETYDHYLDDEIRFVGSTDGEEFLNKKETTGFFQATADQLAGKAKLENIDRTIKTHDGTVIITDLADAFVLDGPEWVYYARFRFTSMLRHTTDGWRFYYQHFSTPDLMATEGETLGHDKITAENLELRSAIKRRTAELEIKNRELEIESALEKVRSRTMAMQRSDELLDVASVMFQQVKSLGVSQWNCGFNIWEKGDEEFTYYPGSPDGEIIPFTCKIPLNEHPVFRRFNESKKRGEELLVYEKKGAEQTDHYDYMLSLPGVGDFLRSMMDANFELPTFQIDHVANFAYGNLIFITYEPVPEMHDVFKRFARVFEQTYTRFLDLQKAEEQAKEAQIEAALERIRSKSMSMRSSKDIGETVATLFDELIKIGHSKTARTGIGIMDDSKYIQLWSAITDQDDKAVLRTGQFDMSLNPSNRKVKNAWKRGDKDSYFVMEGLELIEYYKDINESPDYDLEVDLKSLPPKEYRYQCFFKYGIFYAIDKYDISDETKIIFNKFAQVFEQIYTRYLDLKKVEAQAREAQVEAAMERIRAASLAMHKSNELLSVIQVISNQLEDLKVRFNHASFGQNNQLEDYKFWTAVRGMDQPAMVNVPKISHPMTIRLRKVRKDRLSFYTDTLTPKQHNAWNEHVYKHKAVPWMGEKQKSLIRDMPFARSLVLLPNIFLVVSNSRGLPFSDEENHIIKRVANVFEQAYTRFLDLQKAEAQTRESQIEAALERVRSKTIAMHNSSDVKETVKTFFDEVLKLGIDKSIRCGIGILEGYEGMETWSANATDEGDVVMRYGMLNMSIHPMLVGLKKAWKNNEKEYSYDYSEKDLLKYYKVLNDEPEYPFNADLDSLPEREYHKSFFFSSGIIFTFTENPLTEESSAVLHRFAEVFGQTYRRYLDLRKAEAQAREAQIEAALEKVRSRTMAMQSSSELQEAANLLFLEIQDLGINAWSAGYNILSEDKLSSRCWMSSEGVLQDPFTLYYKEEASFLEMGAFLQSEEHFLLQELGGKELEQHYAYMKSFPELEPVFEHIVESGLSLPTYQINHLCKFSNGYLLFITYEKVPDAHDVFKRFTKVFEQTYTRFLDLQKAENQSIEAQVELALERVRASTMAMHKSEQLAATAEVLFEQFDELGIIPDRISIAVFNEEKRFFELWATDQGGTLVNHEHNFSIDEPTCMSKIFRAWKDGEESCVVDLQGKELEQWVKYVRDYAKMEIDESQFEGRRVQHTAFFSHGYLMLSSHVPISDDMMQLLLRFVKVFQQSYTRFQDLQNAEKQAREAIKRTSVDRVRAEIASMRTTTDLNRITPLVWNELTTLDVPFIRCGVFIMDEELQQIQTHLSTPDGKALASFQLSFEDTEPLDQLLPYWRKKEMYTDHWDKKGFIESTSILMEKGAIKSKETYLTKNQPENLYLHFLPFLQGMLYVGSEVPLSEDELSLAQNLADAFSSAYARYEDFNKLELANKKIEKTLVDLKQAQSQLVQSEKMASLGELTAGIAHEIQNPLNFVNNFSEVSQELMEEMHEEIKNGEIEEALEIGSDIEQNLEKIHHHGKRASEIVKGMLQHSRSSSGVRELTDVNALTDEYLRLAFHGLRAKDKSFNAKMETEFDQSIEKIDVIPQELGRVILNLITNAFYAVDQKKKQINGDFEPKVRVNTKKTKDGMEITVIDNGKGIPKNVLDKIFQPFFTTKPTGQGTGLGLSLSYDIIKAHGGELKVETKEGEGSKFIIKLPV